MSDPEWHETRGCEEMLDLADFRVVGRFVQNVQSARDAGHENVCVYCGIGTDGDLKHEWYCPCAPEVTT